jgi:nucleoside-diphosphate-sugar epimerase
MAWRRSRGLDAEQRRDLWRRWYMGQTLTEIGEALGNQVRDNIHSLDVVRLIHRFIEALRPGEVYNIGGGRGNSCSILEAFDAISAISGVPIRHEYVEEARRGDHICYTSDLSKMKAHYPGCDMTKSLRDIFTEIHDAWHARMRAEAGAGAHRAAKAAGVRLPSARWMRRWL